MMISSYTVVQSDWPNRKGEYYWTISNGAEQRGEFATKAEAQDALMTVIAHWRDDS